jgi:hypothetical protein
MIRRAFHAHCPFNDWTIEQTLCHKWINRKIRRLRGVHSPGNLLRVENTVKTMAEFAGLGSRCAGMGRPEISGPLHGSGQPISGLGGNLVGILMTWTLKYLIVTGCRLKDDPLTPARQNQDIVVAVKISGSS